MHPQYPCVCVAVCCNVLQCVAVCGSVLQCVAVCCSVLQCVAMCAVCCSVLHHVHFYGLSFSLSCACNIPGICFAVYCSALHCVAVCCNSTCLPAHSVAPAIPSCESRHIAQVMSRVAVCCSVLQCVAVCCSVLQCVAVCCSVLQCVAVCCIVLQCVAVCCSVLQCFPYDEALYDVNSLTLHELSWTRNISLRVKSYCMSRVTLYASCHVMWVLSHWASHVRVSESW